MHFAGRNQHHVATHELLALAVARKHALAVVDGADHSYRAPGGREVVARLEGEAIRAAAAWLDRLT